MSMQDFDNKYEEWKLEFVSNSTLEALSEDEDDNQEDYYAK